MFLHDSFSCPNFEVTSLTSPVARLLFCGGNKERVRTAQGGGALGNKPGAETAKPLFIERFAN